MSALDDALQEDRQLRELPSGLWDRLRADPTRAPEHLALAAAERHAPAAAAWVEEKKSMYAASPRELALMAKKRHASLARFSGAATGVGGMITVIPDLAAAAWIQSRCVFFIAASFGFDPHDPMRPAELLVLQGLYPDVAAAREALDGTGKRIAEAVVTRGSDETLAGRLAKMVGKRAVKRLGARLIPGIAIAFNAIGNERDTRALADRAIAFYGG
jgi:hypothetical protein